LCFGRSFRYRFEKGNNPIPAITKPIPMRVKKLILPPLSPEEEQKKKPMDISENFTHKTFIPKNHFVCPLFQLFCGSEDFVIRSV